jgi:ribosomal protein S27E
MSKYIWCPHCERIELCYGYTGGYKCTICGTNFIPKHNEIIYD